MGLQVFIWFPPEKEFQILRYNIIICTVIIIILKCQKMHLILPIKKEIEIRACETFYALESKNSFSCERSHTSAIENMSISMIV